MVPPLAAVGLGPAPDAARGLRALWVRDDRHAIFPAALMAVLIVLMIVPEGLDYRSLATGVAPEAGGFVSRALWTGVAVLSTFIIARRAILAMLLARRLNPFLLLLVALAFASVAWSIDPSLSLRRLIRLGTITLACVAFVLLGWHAQRYQNVVRPVLTAVLLGSLVFGLVAPSLAIHAQSATELSGAWRGLANHKNSLGALACITLVLWAHAGLSRQVGVLAALAGGGIAAACLLLSRSSTSLAAAVFVLLFLLFALRAPRALRAGLPVLTGLLVVLMLVYALGILNLIPGSGVLVAPLAALTDKDVTFTGRTEIWTILSEHIGRRPWLGSGYAAYWTAGPMAGTESFEFMYRIGDFYPGSAHNGYLDVANDLGWLGLAGLVAYMLVQVRQSLRLLRVDPAQATLYLALFFQQAITNLAETHWFSVQSVDFVLMTLTTTAVARGLLEGRLRAAYGEPADAGSRA